MSRYAIPLAAFSFGWLTMTALAVAVYRPEIVADYVRAGTIGAYLAVAGLVVYVAVLHQSIYGARTRPMMPPLLVWGMGVSYLLASGMAALGLWERLGESVSYRPVMLALSLALALCWLVPLVRYLQEARNPNG